MKKIFTLQNYCFLDTYTSTQNSHFFSSTYHNKESGYRNTAGSMPAVFHTMHAYIRAILIVLLSAEVIETDVCVIDAQRVE